jgi:uncharacterized small protein (DUF1192 family)
MAAAREAPVYNTDSIAIYSIDELSEHITVLRQEIARITQEWMSEGESARAALQEEEKRILRELEEKHVDMQTLLDDLHATLRTYETALAAKQPSPPARALWAPKQRGVTQRKGSPYYNPISVAAPSVPRTGVTMRLQNLVKQRR